MKPRVPQVGVPGQRQAVGTRRRHIHAGLRERFGPSQRQTVDGQDGGLSPG